MDWIIKYETTISNKYCRFFFPIKHDYDDKIGGYLKYLYEFKLIDFIEEKLKRGAGSCQIYKETFGVATTEDEALLKKAILDFDWKPGMTIPESYSTEETKKRREDIIQYSIGYRMFSAEETEETEVINVIPEPVVKTVYKYVYEKMPQQNSEEFNTLVQIQVEDNHANALNALSDFENSIDYDKFADEILLKLQPPSTDKKISKSDFFGDEFYQEMDFDDLINKYQWKTTKFSLE
jgi:hypothetical protein